MEVYIIMRAGGTIVAVVMDVKHYAEKKGYEMPDNTGRMRRKTTPRQQDMDLYVAAQATVDNYRNNKG